MSYGDIARAAARPKKSALQGGTLFALLSRANLQRGRPNRAKLTSEWGMSGNRRPRRSVHRPTSADPVRKAIFSLHSAPHTTRLATSQGAWPRPRDWSPGLCGPGRHGRGICMAGAKGVEASPYLADDHDRRQVAPVGDHMPHLAAVARALLDHRLVVSSGAEMAADLASKTSIFSDGIAVRLSELLLQVADADVAVFCQPVDGGLLRPVGAPSWARRIGPQARRLPSAFEQTRGPRVWGATSGGDILSGDAESAPPKHNANDPPVAHWGRSDAHLVVQIKGATRAAIYLAKAESGHFHQQRIAVLKLYEAFVSAFYQLAQLTDEKLDKAELVKKVATVLPTLTAAPSIEGFWRGVCTLLTCESGFRFDRALLFWLNNRYYPAECTMAVGGFGDWRNVRKEIPKYFPGGLSDYIQDAVEHPIPGKGKCPLQDPLYRIIRDKGLVFRNGDEGAIRDLIENQRMAQGTAISLSNADPWVAQVQRETPEIFSAAANEYFLFPLVPLGGHGKPALLGFVIADLCYDSQHHSPGQGAPDLGMVALILNLISGMWSSREDTESYLHALFAFPVLRHNAPHLVQLVGLLETEVREGASREALERRLEELVPVATQLQEAAAVVEGMRTSQMDAFVHDLRSTLMAYCSGAERRHGPVLCCTVGSVAYGKGVRVPPHILDAILGCLVDNAVCSSKDQGQERVQVTIDTSLEEVSERNQQRSSRVLIIVKNDGPPIPDGLSRFLFVDRVSTHQYGGLHRGTGLSTARLQAKAYGGDVILLTTSPVSFGVVLDIMPNAQGGQP